MKIAFVAATLFLSVGGQVATAQTVAAREPSRLTLAGGVLVAAGYGIGDVTAEMRRNTTGAATPFTFLRAESRMDSAVGVDARLGVALNRLVGLELGGAYSASAVAVTISQDAEVPGATATEGVQQYGLELSAIMNLQRATASRIRPYLLGGGGILWQLHDDRATLEIGQTLHVGGGLQYFIRDVSRGRPFGIRAEARLVQRWGGVDVDEVARRYPSFSMLAFLGL